MIVAAVLLLVGISSAHADNATTLAISYWAERGWNMSTTMLVGANPGGIPYAQNVAIKHTRYLNCSIQLARQNLKNTPKHFFVFVPNSTYERDGPPPAWLRADDVSVVISEAPASPDHNRYKVRTVFAKSAKMAQSALICICIALGAFFFHLGYIACWYFSSAIGSILAHGGPHGPAGWACVFERDCKISLQLESLPLRPADVAQGRDNGEQADGFHL